MKVDGTTSIFFINGTLKINRTKIIDGKQHWLKDRQEQKKIHWRPGKCDLLDPFTKHQSGKEHLRFRKTFSLQSKFNSKAQGFIVYHND